MRDDSDYIEQIFHNEELKHELEELTDGQMVMGNMGGELPPEIAGEFLEQILAFENAEMMTHKEMLALDGITLPEPDELNDDELALKLIEVIHSLAEHQIFIYYTNHLNDRELYTQLISNTLNGEGPILPPGNPMNCHIDILGSGSDEDNLLYLKYYADEDTRTRWATDFDMVVPAHEELPYDRDRHLPQPPVPSNPYDDPQVAEAWWAECREKLLRKLEKDGLHHGAVAEEPISYAPDVACVTAIDLPDSPGKTGWWAISGDLPTTYLPAADIPDPRTFLRIISQHWRAATEAMENGNPPAELTIGKPKEWPHLIPMLRHRADILELWANADDAWEEE